MYLTMGNSYVFYMILYEIQLPANTYKRYISGHYTPMMMMMERLKMLIAAIRYTRTTDYYRGNGRRGCSQALNQNHVIVCRMI